MPKRPSIVTDHALVRYLERVYGVDMEGLRRRIEQVTEDARAQGASAANCDGVSYRLSDNGRVVSVTGVNGQPSSNRARRWRRRRT